MPTFVVGWYISHQNYNFYVYVYGDQPSANLEDDILLISKLSESY